VFSYNLPERCYALDVKHPLLVVGTADRHLLVFNLQNPSQPYKQLQSPLKWQTRCVACFPGVYCTLQPELKEQLWPIMFECFSGCSPRQLTM
jgi:hypothetical protein